MRSTFVLFVCLIGGCLALPSKRGACVVTCSPGNGLFENLGLQDCPDKFTCQSTGCGAVCTPDSDKNERSAPRSRGVCAIQCSPGLGLYEDLNLPECQPNYYCSSTGCGALCRPFIG